MGVPVGEGASGMEANDAMDVMQAEGLEPEYLQFVALDVEEAAGRVQYLGDAPPPPLEERMVRPGMFLLEYSMS